MVVHFLFALKWTKTGCWCLFSSLPTFPNYCKLIFLKEELMTEECVLISCEEADLSSGPLRETCWTLNINMLKIVLLQENRCFCARRLSYCRQQWMQKIENPVNNLLVKSTAGVRFLIRGWPVVTGTLLLIDFHCVSQICDSFRRVSCIVSHRKTMCWPDMRLQGKLTRVPPLTDNKLIFPDVIFWKVCVNEAH